MGAGCRILWLEATVRLQTVAYSHIGCKPIYYIIQYDDIKLHRNFGIAGKLWDWWPLAFRHQHQPFISINSESIMAMQSKFWLWINQNAIPLSSQRNHNNARWLYDGSYGLIDVKCSIEHKIFIPRISTRLMIIL